MLSRFLTHLRLKKDIAPLKDLSTPQLMAICDMYWNDLGNPAASPDHGQCILASNELCTRGSETRDWARRLLIHPEYDAREYGAFLLGELGKRGLLDDAEEAVIEELTALANRPFEEDSKELQAVDSAIRALGVIPRAC